MKVKKLFCVIYVCLFTVLPVQAKESERIMIVSEDLPYIIYAEITQDSNITMNFIPVDITIPLTCAKGMAAPISSLNLEDSMDCVKSSIENFFSIKFSHAAYLHLDKVSKDTGVSMKSYDFHKLKDITSFFSKIAKKADMSMIFKYQDYINSDFSIADYYKYYKMSKHKLKIQYSFMKYIEFDNIYLPMDNLLHIRK